MRSGHRNLQWRTSCGLLPAVDNRATRPNKDVISAIDSNVVTDRSGHMATVYRAHRRGEPRIHRHRRDCQSSPWADCEDLRQVVRSEEVLLGGKACGKAVHLVQFPDFFAIALTEAFVG